MDNLPKFEWGKALRGIVFNRAVVVGALVAASFLLHGPASAQTFLQQLNWCVGIDDDKVATPDLRIRGCTAAIESGRFVGDKLAGSFTGRGDAYQAKGQYDLAIQDYDQAIPADPQFSNAFSGRGDAYQAKGQYDRAVQDYDQAIRLSPNNPDHLKKRAAAIAKKKQ